MIRAYLTFLSFMVLCIAATGCDPLGTDLGVGSETSPDTSLGFTINPATGWPDSGSTWTKGTSTVTGLGAWNVALSLPVGSPVPQISANVVDSNTSDVVMMLVSYVGSSFNVLGQVTSNGSGAQQIGIPGGHVVTPTDSIVVRFTTPGATTTPTVGTIGVGSLPESVTVRRIRINAAAASTNTDSPAAKLSGGTTWNVVNPTRLFYPLVLSTGDQITGYRVWAGKFSDLHTVLCAHLYKADSMLTAAANGGNTVEVDRQCVSSSSPKAITLGAISLAETVADGTSYNIAVDSSSGSTADLFGDAELTIVPAP